MAEPVRHMSARHAVDRIFSHTGPALLTTTVVLVVAFGSDDLEVAIEYIQDGAEAQTDVILFNIA